MTASAANLPKMIVLAIMLLAGIVESYVPRTPSARVQPTFRLSMASEGSKRVLWDEQVEYVDLNANNLEPSPTSRTLPLFLLGGAFYPAGKTQLKVFEMKYRTMMFDIANADDSFGYIHTDSSGRIGSIGTLCKVTNRVLQPNGQQDISVEGVSRFRVTKILKTLPYVLAEIEPDLVDAVTADEEAARKLEAEVYNTLKYYMRLMKSYGPTKDLVISQAAKKSRPTLTSSPQDYAQRRTDFSFALANMISMTEAGPSQLLLQTTDVLKRLGAEKEILVQSSDLIAEELMNMDVLTADKRDEIKFIAYNYTLDVDILPPDLVTQADAEEKDEWDLANME